MHINFHINLILQTITTPEVILLIQATIINSQALWLIKFMHLKF